MMAVYRETTATGGPGGLVTAMYGEIPLIGDDVGFVHLVADLDGVGAVTNVREFSLELSFTAKNLFSVTLGGRGGSDGVIGISGHVLLIPVQVGAGISLLIGPGGRFAGELEIDWPVPVPLLPPFVGLGGARGLVVVGFDPDVTDDDSLQPPAPPSALDAAKWVLDDVMRPEGMSLSAWRVGPADDTSVGFGLRVVSLPDRGWTMLLDPAGALFSAGLVAISATGRLIGTSSWQAKAALVASAGDGTVAGGAALYAQISISYPAQPQNPATAPGDAPVVTPPPPRDPNKEFPRRWWRLGGRDQPVDDAHRNAA